MAIDTTEIKGIDTISGSRIIINENFKILKDAINNYSNYVNITDKTINNVQKITINKGTTNITETLIETNGSGSFGGNITSSGNITSNGITINGNSTVSGNISLSNSTSNLINKGNLRLDGELVLTDFNSASLDASNELVFSNSQSVNNLIYNGNTAVAGKLDLTGRNTVILNWSNFVATNDSQYYLHRILLKVLPTTLVGQRVTLISKINEDLSLPSYGLDSPGYYVLRDTISYTSTNPIGTGIKFTKNYDSCELIFDGTNWMVLNAHGCEVI